MKQQSYNSILVSHHVDVHFIPQLRHQHDYPAASRNGRLANRESTGGALEAACASKNLHSQLFLNTLYSQAYSPALCIDCQNPRQMCGQSFDGACLLVVPKMLDAVGAVGGALWDFPGDGGLRGGGEHEGAAPVEFGADVVVRRHLHTVKFKEE